MEQAVHNARLVRFATFEADLRAGELRKAGVKLKLSGQPFQVLAILLESPGEIVTRDELQKRLWPVTFVDGDHSLNTAINRIREVLGDSADNPRFVETLPRRGYRFIGPVEVERAPTPSAPVVAPPGSRLPRFGILMGSTILLLAAAIFLFQRNRTSPPAAQRSLTRLTFDDGLQIGATWSPDSRFIAYSSNRGGKFDIWIQQVSGGDPVQITRAPGQNWQPEWSPDGKYVAFRSEDGEGGLYIVPPLGGAGMERKISAFGYYPRWSPDSSQILFQMSQFGWLDQLFVVDLQGSAPREVLRDLTANRHLAASSAAWHPDGKRITALVNSDPIPTFWTESLAGDSPVKSKVPSALSQQIKEVAADNGKGMRGYEHEWVADFRFVWAPSGRAIYFERTFRGVRNIWRMTVDPATLQALAIERVTTGPGLNTEISLSPDGRKIAFTDESEHVRAWAFPFDATRGRVTGPGQPVTSSGVQAWLHDLSPDGRRLVFSSVRVGKWQLREMSLPDGHEALVVPDDAYRRDYAQWSTDSKRLVYARRNYSTGEMQLMEWSLQDRTERPLTALGHSDPKPFDWSRQNDSLLLTQFNSKTDRSEVAILPIAPGGQAAAAARPIISDPAYDLYQARYSPDNRWIVFEAIPVRAQEPLIKSAIYVVSAYGGQWIRITDGAHWDDKPCWSPDGKIIYFVSGHAGFFNVWGIHFDSARGKAVGDSFPVTALASPGEMVPQFIPTVALSLTQDRLVLTVSQSSGNIWVLDHLDR